MKQTINNTFFCAIIIKIDQWRSCKTWERSKKWGPEKNTNLIENIDVTYSCHILPSYILLCLLAIVLFTLIMFFFSPSSFFVQCGCRSNHATFFSFFDETRDDLLIKRQEPKHTPTNKQPLLKVAQGIGSWAKKTKEHKWKPQHKRVRNCYLLFKLIFI